MGASLAPFGIGTGCQEFLRRRQSQAASRNSSSATSTQPATEHEGLFQAVLSSQIITVPSQHCELVGGAIAQHNSAAADPDVPTGHIIDSPGWQCEPSSTSKPQHAATETAPADAAYLNSHVIGFPSQQCDPDEAAEMQQPAAKDQAPADPVTLAETVGDMPGWGAIGPPSAPLNACLNLTKLDGISWQAASMYLSLCCMHRMASWEGLEEAHGQPAHTTAEVLAEAALRVLHAHDFDLDNMAGSALVEAPRHRAALRPLKVPLEEITVGPHGLQPPDAVANRKKGKLTQTAHHLFVVFHMRVTCPMWKALKLWISPFKGRVH